MISDFRRWLPALLFAVAVGPICAMQDTSQPVISTGPATDALAMRIMHARLDGTTLHVHVAAVGQDGRVPSTSLVGSWTTTVRCRDSVTGIAAAALPLPRDLERSVSTHTVVCLDNSVGSNSTAERVVAAMRLFGYGFTDADSVAVLAYDHGMAELAPFVSGTVLPTSMFDAPASNGLAAMYSAMHAGITSLQQSASAVRDLVVVSATDDNASVHHDLTSVVQHARAAGVRVSVIRVGTASLGYVGRYLAGATGGIATTIHRDSALTAAALARHIVMARRNYMDIAIEIPASYADVPDLDVVVHCMVGGTVLADSVRIPLRPRTYPQQRLIAATFADASDTALTSFTSLLALLAEQAQDDTATTLELIGHVDNAAPQAGKLALRRARHVAAALQRMGVPADRLRIRDEGSSRPLYAFELLPWHRRMNNRVEVRRRTEEAYPYDVVVAKVRTERQAEEQVARWEERGFTAYYDSMVANNEPLYRVLLWGYATRAQAEDAAAIVRSKHNVPTAYVD